MPSVADLDLKPFARTEDMPSELQAVLKKVKDWHGLAERSHREYRERWDELYGLRRNYRRLKAAHSAAENDRDRGGVLLDAQREWGAELFIPYAFATVETIIPRILANDPRMRMRPRKPEARESARAVEEYINQLQLEVSYDLKLQPTARRGLTYGIGVQKTFWRKQTRNMVQTVPSVSGKGYAAVKQEVVLYEGPDAEDVEIRDFFWDPVAKDINSCRWVIHRTWRDFGYVKRMVESGKWFPLDLEAVEGMTSDTAWSSLKQPQLEAAGMSGLDLGKIGLYEVWEGHDAISNEIHTVLNGELVVQNDVTPFYHRELPFQVYTPTMQEGEFVGSGAIEPMKHLQYELNTLRSQRRDNATVALMRPFLYRHGRADPSTFKMGPSVGIPVQGDPSKDIIPLVFPDLPGSAYQEEDAIKSDIERVTGVSDPLSGGTGGGTAGSETATGIQIIQQSLNERTRLMGKNLERQVVRPAGRQWFENLKQHTLEQRPVRIDDPNAPGGFRISEIGPDQLLDDIEGPIPDAGSTEPDDPISRSQAAQSIFQEFRDNPAIDQRKLIVHTLSELGVPNPETFLAPMNDTEGLVDPRLLAGALQQMFGEGPYDTAQILQATEAALQAEQEAQAQEQAAPSAQPPPTGAQ